MGKTYVTNRQSSTKYNAITFLPLSLFMQLKNFINCFFLVNGVLQSIPSISTNAPIWSFLPVGWVIFMGMVFEFIADFRRWKSDKRINNCKIIRCYKANDKTSMPLE